MKANHNWSASTLQYLSVVVNISSSKNESKSQLEAIANAYNNGCCKYQ
nr:hypothetical protein [Daejeonella rubra]